MQEGVTIVGNVLADPTNLWVNMPLIEKYLKRDCIILLKVAKIHILPPIEHKRFSLDQTGHFQLFLLDFFWILRRVSAHFLDFWILKKIDRYVNFLNFILFIYLQGISSGFDIMYLALADRNMQVRFGLKVVWES